MTSEQISGSREVERKLSSQEIIELKRRLMPEEDAFEDIGADVCSYIVLEMAKEIDGSQVGFPRENPVSTYDTQVTSHYDSPEQFAYMIARRATHWYHHLQIAIQLPGDQWPEHMSPPEVFADALDNLEAIRRRSVETEVVQESVNG